jgi:hypothetical protein
VGRPALIASRPVASDLRQFGTYVNPVSQNLDKLTKSLGDSGAINALMDNILYSTTAINGFDGVSHYLRAALIVNTCAGYTANATPGPSCSAKWADDPTNASSSAAAAATTSQTGSSGAKQQAASKPTLLSRILSFSSSPADPSLTSKRQANVKRIQQGAARDSSQALGLGDPVLKYLLGN